MEIGSKAMLVLTGSMAQTSSMRSRRSVHVVGRGFDRKISSSALICSFNVPSPEARRSFK
ncbi:hypothetical protein CHELA41_22223 [Hyphomicrobiales bacterium]|nr:hypothetical protein CHELA41_22223 [Hyphomicrobiales bacterium]